MPACPLTHAPSPSLPPRRSDKARELEQFATRQLGCTYWALEYQGHGDSSPNFLECTLATWWVAVPGGARVAGGRLAAGAWVAGQTPCCATQEHLSNVAV